MANFLTALKNNILVLDGSMGALLQSRGLPAGMAPDVWMLGNKEVILNAHKEYVSAGADIILTNTFGASKWRLEEYDAYGDIKKINATAVNLARKAAGHKVFVAGDIGPCGDTIFPTGNIEFEQAAAVFYEQAKILIDLNIDVIAVETMFDSLEFRCALSAIRAASSTIPIIAHGTFNNDGITDAGASVENIAAIAQGFHISAVGVNCSTGPDPMVDIVKRFSKVSSLPISIQPNAGQPQMKDGCTHFPMSASDLKPYIQKFLDCGANIIGGCCGTTPEFIKEIKRITNTQKPKNKNQHHATLVSSMSNHIFIGGDYPFVPIAEKLNPSGRKKLSDSLKNNDLTLLLQDAQLQAKMNASIMDLNVGVPLVDEPALMKNAVVAIQNKYPHIPLMIDSANSKALDMGADVYYGRPLLNSINAEEEKIEEVVPIAKKHGAALVCLLTGVEVSEQSKKRIENAVKLAKILIEEHNFKQEDLIFDCLGLVVSAMQIGSKETLQTIAQIKKKFPYSATTLGLSNTSFGLPNRAMVNSAFLAAAIHYGLDSAIMSVTDQVGTTIAQAASMWSDKKNSINNFLQKCSAPININTPSNKVELNHDLELSLEESNEPKWVRDLPLLQQKIFASIVDGEKDIAIKLTKEFVESQSEQSMQLFLKVLTPAIRHLGDLFAKRIKFIPHLIAAADAMKAAVNVLQPFLVKQRENSGLKKATIIFATVKGDIHDIGKNICVLMLKNFGYNVIDLGKNVDANDIIETAIKEKAKVLALSALMTTTMIQMKVVIDMVKEKQLPFKVVIGGAVVTKEFAKEIKADGYSTDVGTVVNEMERAIALLDILQ